MPLRLQLTRLSLAYRDGMVLYTATSGAVPALDELRLVVERDGALAALGASRVNIAYLSGIEAEALVSLCLRAVRCVDWTRDWAASWRRDAALPDQPAPARMLVEMAAATEPRADGPAARGVAGRSGGGAHVATNQTLFHADDATMLRRAEAYVARGFTDLKLRVGIGGIVDDVRRLDLLRRRFGDRVTLSIDANGRWPSAAAPDCLTMLAPFGLRYVEQPVVAAAWDVLIGLAARSPMPLMLDELLDCSPRSSGWPPAACRCWHI